MQCLFILSFIQFDKLSDTLPQTYSQIPTKVHKHVSFLDEIDFQTEAFADHDVERSIHLGI